MGRRQLLSPAIRESLFGIPFDRVSLGKYYVLSEADHRLIQTRRKSKNRLGLAIHISLLRHPGQGWRENQSLPNPLVNWLSDQIDVSPDALNEYGVRDATQSTHRTLATEHLGLRPFGSDNIPLAQDLAAKAAFDTDEGRVIVTRLVENLRNLHYVLPATETIERIGLTGRARTRRLAAQALNDALSESQKAILNSLLKYDPSLGLSRLAWLRGIPHSTSAASLQALIDRLEFVRSVGISTDLGENIHPNRLKKFSREGAVAPAHLLSDFGERRRLATLSAQMVEMEITLTDTTIALFEKLTGQLFTKSKQKHDLSWQATQTRVGKLMRLFRGTIDAMELAKENNSDFFELLDEMVGWEQLMSSRPEIDALGDMATEDPLETASQRYTQLRKFAPAFLDAFSFTVPDSSADLQAALRLIKDLNETKKRKLPDIVPMPFPAKHWRSLITKDGKPDRHIYETALMATLRDRLRAGDVWVEGSRDYRRFDTYLTSKEEAKTLIGDRGVETDGPTWLAERRDLLDQRLSEVQYKLKHDQLEGVRFEKGRLKITPHDPITPPEAEQLDRTIDAIMPRIRITELLSDVAESTGFLNAFTELRSGRQHENPSAVLAAILAGATNLGLERMAQASYNLTHSQISGASTWYLRPDTYAEALARIIDKHHALDLAQIWGLAEHTSSDGQFFQAGRNTGDTNAKYGPDPGLKIYSFLSGQYGSFFSKVIGATAGEAPFVLDGLMDNIARFNPLVHYVDTGGVSDHVFALFHLLGMQLAPRLKDFPDRRLACFGKTRQWNDLLPIMGKPINEEVLLNHWDEALRLAGSILNKNVIPSAMLRKLGAYRQQNRLYLALGEIGRIERTLFMLDWIEIPAKRIESQVGLNKGEARHTLAKAVFAHSQGRIHDRSDKAQQKRAMALNLVIASIVYWNTVYMQKAVNHLESNGTVVESELLKHVSPLGWAHINLTGDYFWNSIGQSKSRPLNLKPERMWA